MNILRGIETPGRRTRLHPANAGLSPAARPGAPPLRKQPNLLRSGADAHRPDRQRGRIADDAPGQTAPGIVDG
jgi:hypothetical protein